jgi:hypothetical protein
MVLRRRPANQPLHGWPGMADRPRPARVHGKVAAPRGTPPSLGGKRHAAEPTWQSAALNTLVLIEPCQAHSSARCLYESLYMRKSESKKAQHMTPNLRYDDRVVTRAVIDAARRSRRDAPTSTSPPGFRGLHDDGLALAGHARFGRTGLRGQVRQALPHG